MQSPEYDVVIIGSGPAACAAAVNCRSFGFSVLMVVEKSENEKAGLNQPSESIHPGIATLFNHLGATAVLDKATVGKYEGIQTGTVINYFKDEFENRLFGHHVNKSLFNEAFLQLASDKKVAVLWNESVTGFIKINEAITGIITKKGRTVISKYTIDASGKKRVSAKFLNFKEDFHSPPLLAWSGKITGIPLTHAVLKNTLATFIPQTNGWVWLAPEDSGSCTFTCLSKKGHQDFQLPDELKNTGQVQKLIKSNLRWRSYKKVAIEGLIICGDAGAILDPAAGQGILNAVYSGIKASEAIARSLQEPEKEMEFLTGYNNWFTEEYAKKIQLLKKYYADLNIILT
jgi:flavin-dependent dehydrogenase